MTIKQQGGIFGRNPTFNDVEAAKVNVDTTTDNEVIGQFALWDSTQSAQPYLRMAHSLGTSIGSHTAITVNDMLGSVAFAGSTGTAFYDGASVEGKATQTYTASNGGTKLLFKTTPNGGQTLTEQMSLDQDGTLTVANGNIVIGTSGKGIDFSDTSDASGSTSELFDDYEEGTWTPTYAPSTGSFTSITYGNTGGVYTKIGNICIVSGYISTSALDTTGGSGAIKVGGLPYGIAGSSGGTRDAWRGGSIGYSAGWSGERPSSVFASGGASDFRIMYRSNATSDSAYVLVADMDTSGSNEIAFTLTYRV